MARGSSCQNALQNVYTPWMDDRPVVWDSANRKHIGADHLERGITPKEIDQPEGRYPIHARTASQRIIRRLSSEG